MTSICIIHIILWIYWLLIEHEDTVLRTVFYIVLSPRLHKACVSLVYNVRGEQNVIGIKSGVGGAALQVTAGTLQSTRGILLGKKVLI